MSRQVSQQKNNNNSPSLVPYVGLGGLALVAFFMFKNAWANQNAQNQSGQIVEDLATQQASLFRKYIGTWYQGENEQAIVELAKEVKNWPAVVKAYATLYKGENLENDIRKALDDSQYKAFLANLQAQGRNTTGSGGGYIKPIEVTVKKGQILLLDDSLYAVTYYKNVQDYPSKPLVTVPKGKLDPKKASVVFQQAYEMQYAGGGAVKVLLYQVKLSTGLIVWVNREKNIKKKATVKGLTGYNNHLPISITTF